MGQLINFPSILENTIRLASATHWTPSENYSSMFTSGKSYPLEFNEWTEEWYVHDDQGRQNYGFYTIKGDYVNIHVKNGQKKKLA